MRRYEVNVTVSITPERDPMTGASYDFGNLMFSRKFTISGDNFTDLAPKVDSVYDAITLFADALEVPR